MESTSVCNPVARSEITATQIAEKLFSGLLNLIDESTEARQPEWNQFSKFSRTKGFMLTSCLPYP